MNTRLLRKIQKQILKEPRQFDMSMWFVTTHATKCKIPNCGTAACIAGWATALTKNKNPDQASTIHEYPWDVADRVIGLKDREQSNKLYHLSNWPERFRLRYRKAVKSKKPYLMAKAAVARIDHFIATKGKE